jgi:ribosomal protein L13E
MTPFKEIVRLPEFEWSIPIPSKMTRSSSSKFTIRVTKKTKAQREFSGDIGELRADGGPDF